MPTEADAELAEWERKYDSLLQCQSDCMVIETQLEAKGLALREAGIMAPSLDLQNYYAQIVMARQAPGLPLRVLMSW